TLAWNGFRHFELYYAVSGMGAVCHTVKATLPPPAVGSTGMMIDEPNGRSATGRGSIRVQGRRRLATPMG
ncbi:hypothetical protein, partial [Azospirillum sp. TSO22-1]|uniref:hypothetical protein n=1 Tax=Azospirillum sp. TSO22-1 TaxID=716789 RepID=UPI0011B39B3E